MRWECRWQWNSPPSARTADFAGIDLKQAVELSARLNVYAYDAYVLACAMNQGAPLLTLDGGLKERARELKLDVLEVETR